MKMTLHIQRRGCWRKVVDFHHSETRRVKRHAMALADLDVGDSPIAMMITDAHSSEPAETWTRARGWEAPCTA